MRQPKLKVEEVATASLVPYARNAKLHPHEQVDQIAKSIEEFGFSDPVGVWTNPEGELEIVEGHGRVLAARKLGLEAVPVVRLDHLTDEQRRAYTHVHNQTTLNSGFDLEMLDEELASLDYDFEEFGFDELEDAEQLPRDPDEFKYTVKIDAPIYRITGDEPPVSELFDTAKRDALCEAIERADIDPEVAGFLMAAASRHVVFDYAAIAEFYAHADAEVQRLMEDSGLVIIDFDAAVENGFVMLSKTIEELINADNG